MKFLINPFLGFLLLQIVAAGLLLRRHKPCDRGLPMVIVLSVFTLSLLAMPFFQRWIEASLRLNTSEKVVFSPTHIFVLGGGYRVGIVPEEDLLIQESQLRVLQGIDVWKRYPEAHLVFSGAAREENRDESRLGELMRDMAVSRGVPAKAIILETHSVNTREHPIGALQLPGVREATPVAVVTSGWHMRRAKQEFCRYFYQVKLYSYPEKVINWQWQDLVPSAEVLEESAVLLREWVGIVWYAMLNRLENRKEVDSLCNA